jgi:Protein of unknown function (DUF3040)
MALSMEEQRILDEIEHRLAADDPHLAGSLSAFTRPRLAASLRASRGRLAAAIVAFAAVALAALVVYSFVPFRVIARQQDGPPGQTTHQSAKASAPAAGQSAGASAGLGTGPSHPASAAAGRPGLH